MTTPVHIAAIDAGSNAIRLVIARADSPWAIYRLETERYPVRLGHRAFTKHEFDKQTISKAVKAFRHFRDLMDRHNVQKYRAVATSAAREARNRRELIERVQRKANIKLEVIDGAEEARLVRTGVLGALGEKISPRLIMDLGGGSMEINLMKQGAVQFSTALPIGTVRLMESFRVTGKMDEGEVEAVRHYALSLLRSALPEKLDLSNSIAVACGGNAEALAQIAAGQPERGIDTMSVRLLQDRLWDIVGKSVPQRMKAFGVRKDRAEVMGIAAIVFATVGRWLNLRSLLVPCVGVREGVLRELVVAHFAGQPRDEAKKESPMLAGARAFAKRFDADAKHAEHVRQLGSLLFDQLVPVHTLDAESRGLLETAAVLHDIGYSINADGHHKHGEYLVRNGQLDGINGWQRDVVGALVRYHSKAEPEPHHKLYASLDPKRQRQVRVLASILRIAEALDAEHKQNVTAVDADINRRKVTFTVQMKGAPGRLLTEARKRAEFFEDEFDLKTIFRSHRAPGAQPTPGVFVGKPARRRSNGDDAK